MKNDITKFLSTQKGCNNSPDGWRVIDGNVTWYLGKPKNIQDILRNTYRLGVNHTQQLLGICPEKAHKRRAKC